MKLTTLSIITSIIISSSFLVGCDDSSSSTNSNEPTNPISTTITQKGDLFDDDSYVVTTSNEVTSISAEKGILKEQENQDNNADSKTWNYSLNKDLLDSRDIEFPYTEKLTITYEKGEKKEESFEVDARDELFKYQWHLYNFGQNYLGFANAPKKGIDLNIVGAWNTEIDPITHKKPTGEGVVVAVWDDPVDFEHPDLADRKYENAIQDPDTNAINQSVTVDTHFHGTAVAGIIAATANNQGVRGGAFNAKLISLNNRVDILGKSFLVNDSVNIINMSFGWDIFLQSSKLIRSIFEQLYKQNIPIIKSLGNNFALSILYDASLIAFINRTDLNFSCFFLNKSDCQFMQSSDWERNHRVISVGALDSLGKRASYSSTSSNIWVTGLGGEFGENSDQYDSPAIVTTLMHFLCSEYPNLNDQNVDIDTYFGTYFRKVIDNTCKYMSTMTGTSSSAPTITGIVALMKEVNKDLTVPQVKYILAKSSRNDKSEGWETLSYDPIRVTLDDVFTGEIETDSAWKDMGNNLRFSHWYGFGVPDAKKAIDLTLSCSDDALCKERETLPEVFVSSNNVSCTQEQVDNGYVAKCKLSNLVESNENFEVSTTSVTSNIEVENVSIDIKGFDIKPNSDLPRCDYYVVNSDKAYTYEELKNFAYQHMALALTQISLSDGVKESIIKPYGSFVSLYELINISSSDVEVNVSTNDYYLQNLNPNTEWEVKVQSACPVDIDQFSKYLKLAVHGYKK